jgi:hypothetical protein
MKKILIGLLLTFGLFLTTKADTLDYCRVFYNKSEKIADFVLAYGGQLTIDIKLKSINKTDSITVDYFRDTPCSDCQTFLIIEDEKGNRILVDSKKGTFSGHTFSAKSLVDSKDQKKVFHIYYTEGTATKPRDNLLLLFKIILH